jgi:hypothetical protein
MLSSTRTTLRPRLVTLSRSLATVRDQPGQVTEKP